MERHGAHGGAWEVVRTFGPRESAVIAALDGRSSVESIAAEVADELDLDDDKAFRLVRQVFVDLAAAGVVQPRAAHEGARPDTP